MEEGGEEVVDEAGRDEVVQEGQGDLVEANPPPQKKTMPRWLLKALGPSSAALEAAVIP